MTFEAPRHDLIRGLAPIRSEDNGNVMTGYPIVFDEWTEINSWEGRFMERVAPSGPIRSLKANGSRIKVQYNHGMHPVVGTSGLGKPSVMQPDERGVYTEVPLSETSYNRDIIKPQLADGTLDGMSFRFSVVDDQIVHPKRASDHNPDMLPERTITEFKWFEFGPVDWPAYEASQAGIRSQAALALWVQTPQEQRNALMTQFHIDPEKRLWAPGFDARSTATADTPLGDAATEEADEVPLVEEDGSVDATRQDSPLDEHLSPPDSTESTYQPARRVVAVETLREQRAEVAAMRSRLKETTP